MDSSLAKCMAMENYCMKMEDLIKVSIMKIRSMVKAYILGLMGKFMMEAGKMVKSKVREHTTMKMVINI